MLDQPPSSAAVRLQVRFGSAPPVWYDLTDDAFLIGSVPGCDLRLPGARLPPVVCLITPGPTGVQLRRLVPVQPVHVNGEAVSSTELADADMITIGVAELIVQIAEPSSRKVSPRTVVADGKSDDLARREAALASREQDLKRIHEKLVEVRAQLDAREETLRRARKKLRKRAARPESRQSVDADRLAELTQAAELIAREKEKLDEQQKLLDTWHHDMEQELTERTRQLEQREREATDRLRQAERGHAQFQSDLLHLSRREAALETKQKQLEATALDVDRRYERLQQDIRDLEEQASELDVWHTKLIEDQKLHDQRRAELDKVASEVRQRAAALEGQQAMLASLRTRLERMREEAQQGDQVLAEQRLKHEALELELSARERDLAQREREVEAVRQSQSQDHKRFEERQKVLEAAVAQMRQAQEALEAEEARLAREREVVTMSAAGQAQETALAQARLAQATELQQRLEADRQALAVREATLQQAEQTLATLQEQLRRRSDDLGSRQKALAESARRVDDEAAAVQQAVAELAEKEKQLDQRKLQLDEEVAGRAEAVERRLAGVADRERELTEREETIRRHLDRLKEASRNLDAERQRLEQDDLEKQAERNAAVEGLAAARAELENIRQAADELRKLLPDLEARAREASERLTQARDQWREHLAEGHAFAVQSREDLDKLQEQARSEAERLRQQETSLHRDRAEHRLAVAAFRQQLIDWQGQVAEMQRALAQNSSLLDRRQAAVEEQARQIETAEARLAEQAAKLQVQEQQVAEKQDEVHRHLDDMREWYRHKLRELAGVEDGDDEAAEEDGVSASPPGDRQLGELLRSLGLVDGATLSALLAEARRQRRSLRQLMLSGGYLTLYQMALIEAGNVAGLVLGPVRLLDRLGSSSREAVYLVYDPRRDRKAVLRHLSEADAADAVRPDEFRQRFAAAAALSHPNLAATLEVLDVGGRPAVLQEWLQGLPSGEWPAFAAVPGVWYRLVNQAALALHTAHGAGQVHGRLRPSSFVLTTEGILKLCGLGEPAWLAAPEDEAVEAESTPASDLAALGRVAAAWASPEPSGKKGGKAKPLPEVLQSILGRLTSDNPEMMYPGMAELLADLDRVGEEVPANAAAWERLVRHVRDQVDEAGLRLSA